MRRSGRLQVGSLAGLVLLLALAPRTSLAEPVCVVSCRTLAAEGSLAEGVTVEVCAQRTCHEEARLLYRTDRFPEALESIDYLEESRQTSPAYHLDRGLILYALERYAEALVEFDFVVRVFPEGVRPGSQRAHTLARLGRVDEAEKQFRLLLQAPGAEVTYRGLRTKSYLTGNIALLELRRGNFAKGKALMEEALEIDGTNQLASSYLYRVIPSLEAGTLEPAGLTLLEESFEDMSLGRYQKSADRLRQVIERWPAYGTAYLLLAQGLRNQKRFEDCETLLATAETHIADDSEITAQRIHCGLLWRGVNSDDSKPLIAELRALNARDPDNRSAADMLRAIEAP